MPKKPTLTRAAIIAAPDLKTERVDVPEWGGEVILQELTADARDAFELETLERARLQKAGQPIPAHLQSVRARLVARCLVDEEGARLFETADELEALGRKNGDVLDRLFDVARGLNTVTAADVADAGKDSPSDPSA